jgi:hypothetical protein
MKKDALKYMINRLWYVIFHITCHINPRPILIWASRVAYMPTLIVFRNHVAWFGIWCNNVILYNVSTFLSYVFRDIILIQLHFMKFLKFWNLMKCCKKKFSSEIHVFRSDQFMLLMYRCLLPSSGLRRKHEKCSLCNKCWNSFGVVWQTLDPLPLLVSRGLACMQPETPILIWVEGWYGMWYEKWHIITYFSYFSEGHKMVHSVAFWI